MMFGILLREFVNEEPQPKVWGFFCSSVENSIPPESLNKH
jgi:hypothetical protein